ncbi:KAP family P-loop NTPase fold protein [Butyrivibrio sp. YAB3001]|uniref:KAP family P-loop NTPase fold protein n=1 Tax=Butyrivibrio sp. YAB3001 TaxID=1520812 RepID=UPI0008F62854|nr:P-loop NTPase fold protein [Butyrivibrio sp. YAB3001]SFC34320.1 KAP family P-loop domain-containing protein [Butyrivibrio sp. YAB3001]
MSWKKDKKEELASTNNGCIDVPAVEDEFNISKYINGLTSFIWECKTPMTIAIQGDWGTGKTSVMQMIYNEISDKTKDDKEKHCIWFNTWQFSQFDLGEKLPLLMMSKLITGLGGKDTETLKNSAKDVLAGIINIASGVFSQGAADSSRLTDALFKEDFTKSLERMNKIFEKIVEKNLEESQADRVVIFVDDLDRLAPEKAVELLEVMKNFLDCENCVFVLAIDYGVVVRGVRKKYGNDFDEEKGKSFFDKIIQVPFKMPVSDYDIKEYVRINLEHIGVSVDETSLKLYVNLIGTSIGSNPRSMKRLFNSFFLLKQITPEIFGDHVKRNMLFVLLCLQSRYENVYNYMIRNKDDFDAEMLKDFQNEESDLLKSFSLDDKAKVSFINFAEFMYQTIDSDGKGGIDPKEIGLFRDVLKFSSITATDTEPTGAESKERTYYYAKIKTLSKIETVSFRSQLRNAAMLGSLAYVMIKQYLMTNHPAMEEFKQQLSDNRISGDWLIDDETTIMAGSDVNRVFKDNNEGFSHFLTHYFVWNYKDCIKELNGLPSFKNGVDGMQVTFPPIEYEGESYFISRYWSETSIDKMINLLKLGEYIKINPEMIEKEITVFSDDEIDSMSKRKCAFRKV